MDAIIPQRGANISAEIYSSHLENSRHHFSVAYIHGGIKIVALTALRVFSTSHICPGRNLDKVSVIRLLYVTVPQCG